MKKKENSKPNSLIQTLVYSSNIYYSKIYQRGNWKNISTLHLEVWIRYFRHRYSIKLSRTSMNLKIIRPTNPLWKGLMLFWLNLKNNSNQGLCLFRQKQILRSSRHKNLQNQNNEVFLENITIYRIKCNADNKPQNFQMWPKPFIKSFTSIITRLFFANKFKKLRIYKLKSTS